MFQNPHLAHEIRQHHGLSLSPCPCLGPCRQGIIVIACCRLLARISVLTSSEIRIDPCRLMNHCSDILYIANGT